VEKYLRRHPAAVESAFLDGDPAMLGASGAVESAGMDAAIVASILRKIDILQSRDRKFQMMRTIARLPRVWVPRVFVELLGDGSDEVRESAARELAERDDCPIEILYEKLRRPPWYVKSAILRILATKARPESLRSIREVIDDPNVEVKRAAAQALGAIGGPEARRLLVQLIRDGNPMVRIAATEALERIVELRFS
jgi:HEAT repeat protein